MADTVTADKIGRVNAQLDVVCSVKSLKQRHIESLPDDDEVGVLRVSHVVHYAHSSSERTTRTLVDINTCMPVISQELSQKKRDLNLV